MKYIFLVILFTFTNLLYASPTPKKHYTANIIPEHMSVAIKKERFYYLLVPAIEKVHKELQERYLRLKKNVKYNSGQKELANLRRIYKLKTNEELLVALKPHPQSIVIAQAAMESGWATSRFFREANNVFGVWSKNKNEPRIAANVKRNGKYTIWLRKFPSIEESIKSYYRLMAKGDAFKEFRKVRYETDDVFQIVKKLDKYSEIGALYGEELSKMIRFNKLQKYDK